jgi:drug/metabolite transporter (DMT)-like permease
MAPKLAKAREKAYLEIMIATILWGVSYPINRIALGYSGPMTLGALRGGWCALFFVLYFLAFKKRITRENIWLFIGISLTGLVLPLCLLNVGMLHTTASLSGIIQATAPLGVVVMAYFVLKESATKAKWLGVLLGLFGTALVVLQGSNGDSTIFGNLLIFGSAISLATLAILEKIAVSRHEYTPTYIMGVTSILGFPVLLILSLCLEGGAVASHAVTAYAFLLALPCTVVPYLLWLDALRKIDISKASLFMYCIPIFGIFFSVILLNEMITGIMVVGMAIIFLGVFIAQK